MRPGINLLLAEHKELEVSETPSQVEVTSLHPLIPSCSRAQEGPHNEALSPQRNMHDQYARRMLHHSSQCGHASPQAGSNIAGSKGWHIVVHLVELPTT